MNTNYQIDMVNFLRASLRHFQDNRDLGDQTDVIEIECLLLRRIAEMESALQRARKLSMDCAKNAA
jgi:hypothetical protein